ncbi:TM2 domain protein [Novipirellula aureliae]|uniref:TM2 domain protein n=1 Tax=Novipirellula aureliae TaxID=2527966 RepID=A0A5C6E8K5_9BACT|nr:TM2 domain-containing protein [Novipirellula aureliae]TWU44021.1 TM2 domain protein [Novipirellula aureliae]
MQSTSFSDSSSSPSQRGEDYLNRTASAYNAEISHPALVGYLFWILGFVGAHRFYFGKPLTGILWFFTGGLFLVGWIIDLFLIPNMADEANARYRNGSIDYTVAWILLTFLGLFGVHRLYMGKIVTGVIYLLTGGLLGIGFIYDTCTLNEQVEEINLRRM